MTEKTKDNEATNISADASIGVSEDRLHLDLGDREITLKVHLETSDGTILDPMRDDVEPEVRRTEDLVHWDVETDEYHLSILPEVLDDDV